MEEEAKKLNEKWTNRKLIEETINSMSSHTIPAPETKERLKALEVTQKFIMEEISEIKELVKGLDEKLNCALDKKAGIWVEKVLIWLGIVIGAGLLGYLGSLLIKLIEL